MATCEMFRPSPFAIVILSFVFLVLYWLSLLPVAASIECVESRISRIRVFKSLIDLQANKIPFDPQNENSTGNIISFENTTEVLPINSFITLDGQHIRNILLDNHQIHQIDAGAFLTLKCVSSLTLRNNTIAKIEKYMFRGLSALHELDFGENTIKEIPEHVFYFTPRLKKLNFTKNSVRHVRPESFYNLLMLEELDLSYNYLNTIPPLAFQYLENLVNLQMGSNEFEQVDAYKWSNLTKLKVLNLSDNLLSSFELYTFSFRSTLVELYVDDNYLTKLYSWGLRYNFPALKRIDISKNSWACEDLISVINLLNNSRIDYGGSEEIEPNISGISCNRTLDTYERNKWVNPIDKVASTPHPATTSSSDVPAFGTYGTKKWVNPIDEVTSTPHPGTTSSSAVSVANGEKFPQGSINLTNVNIYVLNSSQNVYNIIIVCLFIMVIIFIVIDIPVRIGCCNSFGSRRRRGEILDKF